MINDADQLTRQILGNVPGWLTVVFYACTAVACGWAGWVIVRRFRQHRRGRAVHRREKTAGANDTWPDRVLALPRYLAFHRKLLGDRDAGIAHLLVFYGFLILLAGTTMVFLEHDTPLHFYYGRFYLVASLVIDLGGVAFIVGLIMFLRRRLAGGTTRILRRVDVPVLAWLLLAIAVTGFLLEGSRIAFDRPDFERWSIVGYGIATGLNMVGVSGDAALGLHRGLWILHAVLCVVFFVLLPWKFFSHMVFAPVSLALRTDRPRAALATVGLREQPGAIETPGATSWNQMPWLDLLQADACTTCGRCNAVCPAHAAGKPLRPRDIVLGVRAAMDDASAGDPSGGRDFGAYIEDDALWACTTCAACNEACPVEIEVFNKIVLMRQGRVEVGVVPAAAATRFENAADQFNPFDTPSDSRMDWAAGLAVPVAEPGEHVDLLYWVGCAGSFDPEGRSVSRAMIKILNHLDLSYRVLGRRERCTGDPVRRMGEEGLFQELAAENIRQFKDHKVARLLTQCPHCFNTIRNEYPELGDVSFEVEHHTQFLARMIAEGKLKLPGSVDRKVTFHDPCYLGRGNGETEAPRHVLHALPQLAQVEMPRHGRESFCCGAGGGSMWLDVSGSDRIENQRAAEAVATEAETIVTGCPFCKGMLQAGCQSLEATGVQVQDLAELIVQAECL